MREAKALEQLRVLPDGAALTREETAARLSMFAAMLDAFPRPRSQEAETTLEVFLELTSDIPLLWLVAACRRLMLSTTFLPTIAEIRNRAALEILRSWRTQIGKDPDRSDSGKPVTITDGTIDHWIDRGRKLEGLPEIPARTSAIVPLPEGWRERIEKLGSRAELQMLPGRVRDDA